MIERDPNLAQHASTLHGAAVETAAAAEEQPVAQARGGRAGRRTAWVISMMTMGLLVGAVVIVFIKFVNGPVQASAIPPTPTPRAAAIAVNQGTIQLAGLYFEMGYPGKFDQLKQLGNDAHSLEQYYVTSKADYRRTMAVAVRPLESSSLDNDANYKVRKIHPETYKERVDKLGGEPVSVMSKIDNTEATLFWAHKGRVLSVSMTSTNPDDVLADYIKLIEPTFRWKE
jgi:hypothetical protein